MKFHVHLNGCGHGHTAIDLKYKKLDHCCTVAAKNIINRQFITSCNLFLALFLFVFALFLILFLIFVTHLFLHSTSFSLIHPIFHHIRFEIMALLADAYTLTCVKTEN